MLPCHEGKGSGVPRGREDKELNPLSGGEMVQVFRVSLSVETPSPLRGEVGVRVKKQVN
jgi:hypothetical protein